MSVTISDVWGDAGAPAKVRAIQNGNSLDPGNAGLLGSNIDCVGGIAENADAHKMICYLVPAGVAARDYKTDPSVISQEVSGSNISCPSGLGFGSGYECFSTNFDAANFASGDWRFIAVFYSDEHIDLKGERNFKVTSFFVLPESGIAAMAILGSSLAAFAAFIGLKKQNLKI